MQPVPATGLTVLFEPDEPSVEYVPPPSFLLFEVRYLVYSRQVLTENTKHCLRPWIYGPSRTHLDVQESKLELEPQAPQRDRRPIS